jgi:actin-related protein
VHQAITACDEEIQAELYGGLVLTGGNTLLRGMETRLQRELRSRLRGTQTAKLITSADRLNSAWIGGAVLASLSTFSDQCILKADYEEQGPSIVHAVCL